MTVMLFNYFLLNYFIFVESYPIYNSIARDFGYIKDCNSTFPVDRTTLNLALVNKGFQAEPNENFKCFLLCLYEKYNWMNQDGVFQNIQMKSTLAESNLEESSIEYLLTTCTEIDVEDKCDRAYLFTDCFWTESDKLVNLSQNSSLNT